MKEGEWKDTTEAVFEEFKGLKPVVLEEWLKELPTGTMVMKHSYSTEGSTCHALSVLNGKKTGVTFMFSFDDDIVNV